MINEIFRSPLSFLRYFSPAPSRKGYLAGCVLHHASSPNWIRQISRRPQEAHMPRRPAKVTQADIARALRAAKEAGAHSVTIDSEGFIRIELIENSGSNK